MPSRSFKMVTPRVPNFISLDGAKEGLSVGKLTDEEIKALALDWGDALKKRRDEIHSSPTVHRERP